MADSYSISGVANPRNIFYPIKPMSEFVELLIVGAGPSGIAAAIEAKRQGLSKIKILEKGASHSSMIRTFYKEGKRVDAQYAGLEPICFGVMCLRDGNRESFLSFMDHAIASNGVDISYNCEVWAIEKKATEGFMVKSSLGDFDARTVVIAIGKMGRPRTPDYYSKIPNSLKNNKTILFDINSRDLKGLNVLVVGGGDSAGEYLDMLHAQSKVTWSYRQTVIAKMNDSNKKIVENLIRDKKIEVLLGSQINGIEDENSKAKVVFSDSNIGTRSYDAVLYALGGVTPVNFLKNISVKVSEAGEAEVNQDTCESSVSGLYLTGDLLGKGKGGGSIISGFNSAHAAVRDIVSKHFSMPITADEVNLDHLKF
ncbi:MAG: NAD(P)-binding domain-containing protein [Proteobacteria bacterium]|nr:NAD(P)-binding domain-containing protein [Pseudomonadota bacterium]